MKLSRTVILGLSHRLAYAALVSALVWIGAHLPLPAGTYPPSRWGVRNTLVRVLDLPIAAATQVLPCNEFAIDLWFTGTGGEGCPHDAKGVTAFFINHMRVGVPTYLLLFYLPAIARAGRNRWRRRFGGEA